MTASDVESWARLRLVQGESTAQVWELVSSLGQTTLTVGSNAGCNWIVRDDNVAPIHFSLHWDGATLRIADTYGAGDVRIDGSPVSAQWRSLAGRVRIDFGKAAIVVETSGAPHVDSPHPLDPSPQQASSSSSSPARAAKATLLGVSPFTPAPAPAPAPAAPAAPAVIEAAPASQPASADAFRAARSSDHVRPHKPTLLGISTSSAPASWGGGGPPEGTANPAPSASPAPKMPAGTLIGVGLSGADVLNAMRAQGGPQQVAGAGLGEDQHTMQGYAPTGSVPPSSSPPGAPSGRRVTQSGMVSESPGVAMGAVARAPVRTVSSGPAASTQRVGSTWQEVPEDVAYRGELVDGQTSGDVPQAVLTGEERASRTSSVPPRKNTAHGPRPDRFSDAPTQMRDMAEFESKRVRRPFPWSYVGIVALTAVAYFAWLYLLDHL